MKEILILTLASILCTCAETQRIRSKTLKDFETLGSLGSRPVLKSVGEGAPNGTDFDDVTNISTAIFNVRSISIISMYQVDYLQFTYELANKSLYHAPAHGDGIFNPETITLAKDEYIEKIEGSTSFELINQLTFTLNRPNRYIKRVIGPYGKTVGKHNFTFEGFIFGFHGKTGRLLQNLGVYYIPPVKESKYFGYPLRDFIENPDTRFPPVIKIRKIFIFHSDQIDSIQLEYQLHGGRTKLGVKHGGTEGNLTSISFSNEEGLVGVKGMLTYSNEIGQLSFVSSRADGSTVIYGPFGKLGKETFYVGGGIFGYTGYTGRYGDGFKSTSFFYYET